jgi:hypothetical protein
MNQDDASSLPLNRRPGDGHIRQGLAAKRTAGMAQKNQEHWGLGGQFN